MVRLLIDEDLPRSLARVLGAAGFDATDVRDEHLPRSLARALRAAGFCATDGRDVHLRGCSDEDVHAYAVRDARAVVTADVDFGNILRFPLGEHAGIIVARFPNEVPPRALSAALLAAIRLLDDDDMRGCVVVITPSRIRIRRPA